MKNSERLADMPRVAPDANPSSIGGLWPPSRNESHGRIKAIYTPGVINSTAELAQFAERFVAETNHMFEYGATRVQFRAVMEADFLRSLASNPWAQQHVEAVMALDAGRFGKEPVLVYWAANDQSRQTHPHDLLVGNRHYELTAGVERRPAQTFFSKTSINGFTVEILEVSQDASEYGKARDQIYQLYKRFGWDKQAVDVLLANPNNVMAIARLGDQIVSAGIAETAIVPIGNDFLRIVEITEAATLAEYGGYGLYTAGSGMLLMEIARKTMASKVLGGAADIVFGECNSMSPAVLQVVKIQGRTFCRQIGAHYGYPNSGILRQQVPIEGGVERISAYNDLYPAFLTRKQLLEYYGGSHE